MKGTTLDKRQALLQAFHEISEAIVSQQGLNKILELILDKALDIVGTSIGWLSLLNEETERLDIVVSQGLPEECKGESPKVREGITGWVAKTGKVLNIPDVSEDDRYYRFLDEIRSELCVPLVFRNRTIGVLNMESQDKEAFSRDDENLLTTFAAEAVVAIEMTRLFEHTSEELEQRVRELEALRRIYSVLSSSLDLDTVLNLVLDSALELGKARGDQGHIQLVDKATGELVIRASRGLPEDRKGTRSKIGEGVTGWVAEKRESALIGDVTQEPWSRWYEPLIPNMRSELAVPLLIGDQVTGVLNLESPEVDAFDEDDVRLVQALAAQAVIAIQNAEQYANLEKALSALQEEQERRIASERWEALGKAAANLAHRLNNVIGIIPVCVQELHDLVSDDPLVRENLEIIERNAKFTLELAENLVRPSRPSATGLFDINLLLKQAVEVAEVPHRIKVVAKYRDPLPKVRTSKLIVELFVELIANAVKAMPDKGELELNTGLVDDKWVEVRFTDTGCGIPMNRWDRIFDLFVVAREGAQTQALGFGLWWAKTFLNQHEGDIILLESQVGKGSTFLVRLPVEVNNR